MLHRATGNAKVREVKNREWPLHAYIVAHVVNTFLPLRESYRSSNTSLPTRTLRLRPSNGGVMKKCSQIFIIICVFNWETVTQFTCVRGSAWSRIPCMVRFPINGITIEYTEIKMSLGLPVNYRTDHSWITGQKMFFFFFGHCFNGILTSSAYFFTLLILFSVSSIGTLFFSCWMLLLSCTPTITYKTKLHFLILLNMGFVNFNNSQIVVFSNLLVVVYVVRF